MLAKIYILLSKGFVIHYALVIISNVILNAYQASLTIIGRNLLQVCVCIVCVVGGLMVVSFLKALRIDFKNIPLFDFKDK